MRYQPQFENYMDSVSKNYGLNSLRFFDGDGNVYWFSYTTLVAFKKIDGPVVCVENQWGPTTGRHLNAIEPDKSKRVSKAEFDRLYDVTFGQRVAS